MRLHRLASWFLILLVLPAACHKKSGETAAEEAIVARVGQRPITRSYFEDRLAKMDRKFLPDTLDLAGKREFLQLIINKEVMALKTEQLGYPENPEVQEGLRRVWDILAEREVSERLTEEVALVTEEEARQFYERKKEERLVKHILLDTRAAASDVLAQIRRGADFDSLVTQVSLVPQTDDAGEPLPLTQRAIFGWVAYGQADPRFEAAIFATPLNQVSEPVQTAYGWHLLMPVSTREKKETPFEDQRQFVEEQIRRRKRRAALNDYYNSILEAHDFELNEEALNLVYAKLPPDAPPPADPSAEVKPVIDFGPDEVRMKLFEVDGKEYKIGDFSDTYDRTAFLERPRRQNGSQGLYYWIRDAWLKPLQLEQARKDGIYDLPEVANEAKFRHEEIMVGMLHDNLIAQQVPEPTEAELQAFFAEHAATYVDKEKRVCNLIFHPRERVVQRAYAEIQGGADFVDTAIRYNDNAVEAKDVRTVAFPRDDQKHAEIAAAAFALQEGKYSEPFKTTQGWILLQVQQIIPERPFVLEDVREFVVDDWKAQWSENRLNELIEEWRKEFPLEVFDAVLEGAEVRRQDVVVPGRVPSAPAANEGGR